MNLFRSVLGKKRKKNGERENVNAARPFANSLSFPMPTVRVSSGLDIIWYNSLFEEEIDDIDAFADSIKELLASLDRSSKDIGFTYSTDYKTFDVVGKLEFIHHSDDYSISLHLIDRTNERNLINELIAEKTVVCWILVDNYDDLMKNVAEHAEKDKNITNSTISQIDDLVDKWAEMLDSSVVKHEKDRYYLVFKNGSLNEQINEKFEFLANFNKINKQFHMPVTISVGIGVSDLSPQESAEYAETALDMALGRGGDQTVIKTADSFQYFGGRSIEKEKRTKVKLRLVADALLKLLPNNDSVFIMGHKFADIDCIGAAVGLCSLMRARGIPASIVLDEKACVCKNYIEMLKSTEEYANSFISPAFAEKIFEEGSLLFIVDCHLASLVECPELLDKNPQIVVLDHHRRDAGFIEDTALVYHEPYISSASEMVVEILQYIGEEVELMREEIQCLFAGIVLDTKNFQFKAGVRTFEAAAYLKTLGVDTIEIKRMFQEDFRTFEHLAECVNNSEIYREQNIICMVDASAGKLQRGIVADNLIDIQGIDSSFVLTQNDDTVDISARSLGDINVQLVMEKLGGGGHLNSAGCQFKGTMEETIFVLKNAIDETMGIEEE
ncbi:MAG: DHH family phosphoesterase [Oscillospiraceae bacterium]|nr:DHH family phosphoesterase [Oscillospiraceae bacterium]